MLTGDVTSTGSGTFATHSPTSATGTSQKLCTIYLAQKECHIRNLNVVGLDFVHLCRLWPGTYLHTFPEIKHIQVMWPLNSQLAGHQRKLTMLMDKFILICEWSSWVLVLFTKDPCQFHYFLGQQNGIPFSHSSFSFSLSLTLH